MASKTSENLVGCVEDEGAFVSQSSILTLSIRVLVHQFTDREDTSALLLQFSSGHRYQYRRRRRSACRATSPLLRSLPVVKDYVLFGSISAQAGLGPVQPNYFGSFRASERRLATVQNRLTRLVLEIAD